MGQILRAYAKDDPGGTTLGTLTEAADKVVTVEDNGIGAGAFSLSLLSSQLSWAQDGNYVAVWRDAIAGDPVAGFWIEAPTATLVSSDEEGGRTWTAGGRGPIVVLERALVWHRNLLGGNGRIQRRRGRWLWRGRIQLARPFIRLLREAKARGSIPFVTWDFTRDADSDGVAWPAETRVRRFEVPIGATLLELVTILRGFGLHVYMDASFVIHAWPEYERDLSGSITLSAGVDIRGDVTRTTRPGKRRSHVLVGGERNKGGQRFRPVRDTDILASLGWRQEAFRDVGRTATRAALQRAGRRSLRRWKKLSDGASGVPVIDTTGQVALVDYIPGDTVALTIPGGYDGPERIASITLVDDDAGNTDPVVEFGAPTPDGNGVDWDDDAGTSVGAG